MNMKCGLVVFSVVSAFASISFGKLSHWRKELSLSDAAECIGRTNYEGKLCQFSK